MFEVKLIFPNGETPFGASHCKPGDLLPTIATLLQLFEAEHGTYEYQRPYAIKWRRIKE